MSSDLPIPENTMRRSAVVRRAAILYIHTKVKSIAKIATEVGYSANKLRVIKNQDAWDDFATSLASKSVKSVYSHDALALMRGEDQKVKIVQELSRQDILLEKLVKERDRLTGSLAGFEAGTKAHVSAVSAIGGLTSQIESILGLDSLKKEQSALRQAVAKKQLGPKTDVPRRLLEV